MTDPAARRWATGRGFAAGTAVAAALVWLGGTAWAQAPAATAAEVFRDADLPLGERLIREHKCSECHARKMGGDGSAIYRPAGRIGTPSALRGMVDYCSTELNLGLFPEEVTAVGAVLQRDHYRFGMSRPATTTKP